MGNLNCNHNSNIILPQDVFNTILQHNPHDKIYYSFVSKLWNKICKDNYEMIKNKDKYPINCAYDLNLWLKDFGKINHKGLIYNYFHDKNIKNVLTQYAMDNGILYGCNLEKHIFVKLYDDIKFEKIIGMGDYGKIMKERDNYCKIIDFSIMSLFNEYCESDIVNKYTIFVIKVLVLYHKQTYLELANKALCKNAKNITMYLKGKYNEK